MQAQLKHLQEASNIMPWDLLTLLTELLGSLVSGLENEVSDATVVLSEAFG